MAFFRQIRRGLTYKFKVRALREYNQQQRARSVASRYSGDPTGSIWKAWDNSFNHRLKDKFILSSVQREKAAGMMGCGSEFAAFLIGWKESPIKCTFGYCCPSIAPTPPVKVATARA